MVAKRRFMRKSVMKGSSVLLYAGIRSLFASEEQTGKSWVLETGAQAGHGVDGGATVLLGEHHVKEEVIVGGVLGVVHQEEWEKVVHASHVAALHEHEWEQVLHGVGLLGLVRIGVEKLEHEKGVGEKIHLATVHLLHHHHGGEVEVKGGGGGGEGGEKFHLKSKITSLVTKIQRAQNLCEITLLVAYSSSFRVLLTQMASRSAFY